MATSSSEQPRNSTSHVDLREINKLFNKKNETPDGEVGKDMNANFNVYLKKGPLMKHPIQLWNLVVLFVINVNSKPQNGS